MFRPVFLCIALFLCLLTTAAAQDADAKAELFSLLKQYRRSWDAGYVHARYSGFLALGPESEAKLWWTKDGARLEATSKGNTKTFINTPARSAQSRTGQIFVKGAPGEAKHQGFRVHPNDSWLSAAGPKSEPIEKWLVSRAVDPLFVKTPTGFAAVFAYAADEDGCKQALEQGLSLDSVRFSKPCFLLSFNEQGLPVDLSWFGEIPEHTFTVKWEWDDSRPPRLRRLIRTASSDFGKTRSAAAELVVLDSSRQPPPPEKFIIPE